MKTDHNEIVKRPGLSDGIDGLTPDSHDSTVRNTARAGGDGPPASDRNTTRLAPPGLTLEQYAEWLKLPIDYLAGLGLSQISSEGRRAVKVPFYDQNGEEESTRLLLGVSDNGECLRRWKKGCRPYPYGLWRDTIPSEAGYTILVDDEIDCHALWFHGLPGLRWEREHSEALVALMREVPTIYVVAKDTDTIKDAVSQLVAAGLQDRLRLMFIRKATASPADLHRDCPDTFAEAWDGEVSKVLSWAEYMEWKSRKVRKHSWKSCHDLAEAPSILERFAVDLACSGVVGEERMAKLVYLAVTSRLLGKCASLIVRGPSSSGKSYVTGKTLEFFPPSAYYTISSTSEKGLIYIDEPMAHRMLVVYELAGLDSKFSQFLSRAMMDGVVRHQTPKGVVEIEGPIGMLVTTTQPEWHQENETRMLAVTADDSAEQTRRVLEASFSKEDRGQIDMQPWHGLQDWLAAQPNAVVVPFADLIPRLMTVFSSPRLRRDGQTVLSLVRAHALLHQASRKHDGEGRIVAKVDDYAAVRTLVADLIAAGIQKTVPEPVRRVAEAVAGLQPSHASGVPLTAIARVLGIDKSTASRNSRRGMEMGYLRDLATTKGRPAQIVVGDPMPDDADILPSVEQLEEALQRCGENAAA
jgi:hypothetical protein